MGLDLLLFRAEQGGNPELVKESQRRRFKPEEAVTTVIEADNKWRHTRHELDEQLSQKRKVQKDITAQIKHLAQEQKKQGGQENVKVQADAALLQQKQALEDKILQLEAQLKEEEAEVLRLVQPIGNIVHASVPVSKDEKDNEIVRTWGQFPSKTKHHHELLYMIDGFDAPRGTRVAGHRGYFLKGVGVKLNLALINYSIDFLAKRNYTALQTPYFMEKQVMACTAQLEQFDEELYKVTGEDDKYLIATSEQPISAFHQGEWLEPKELPLKYAGMSTCFRKEAGAHGKDTWGIFRVHQFDKIEQFCITAPEKSWEMHEEMISISEQFYQSLGIPYRVVNLVSGELNNAAAKKYDLEGWFPGFNEFRELVSCSNCTDYQARALEVRYGVKKQGAREKKYVHMLNSTLCATTRTICAILENYQTEEGVKVPEVLKPYMCGLEFLPFVHKEIPTAKGAKGKKKEKNQEDKPAKE